MNTVTALTCPECGALGLDCEPSSEDGALYNCPECDFYRIFEIESKDDWQDAETELEQKWVQLQDLPDLIDYTDVEGTRHNVSHYHDSIGSIRNILQEAEEDGWSEDLQKRINNQKRQRKLAMQSLAEEIQDLEALEDQFGGETQ